MDLQFGWTCRWAWPLYRAHYTKYPRGGGEEQLNAQVVLPRRVVGLFRRPLAVRRFGAVHAWQRQPVAEMIPRMQPMHEVGLVRFGENEEMH